MDFKLLLLTIAVVGVAQVKSEMAVFAVETSELCTDVSPEPDNAHLTSVYRYYNDTQQCYKVGEKGPCGELMKFYADPTNGDYGDCDCDHSLRCHRPLIYWPEEARCYMAYEQGPCNTDEWITLDHRSQLPRCETNPCTNKGENSTSEFDDELEGTGNDGATTGSFWFQYQETKECYKTNTQGPCTFPNEVVVFNGFSQKVKPRCTPVRVTCSLPKDPTLFCVPGQKWSVLGHCFTKPKCTRHGGRGGRRGGRRSYRWHGRKHHAHPSGMSWHDYWALHKQAVNRTLESVNENLPFEIPAWSTNLQDLAANDTVRNKWSGFMNRHHHHHHFHNHSSVGPQWKRNSHLKRTSAGRPLSRSRTNTNYVELERVDFRNNGDEFIGAGSNIVAEADPSGEKK